MLKPQIIDYAIFGGTPLFNTFKTTMSLIKPNKNIFFNKMRHFFDAHETKEPISCITDLESYIANFCGTKHCIAFANCFYAMSFVVKSIVTIEKNEVVLPALTYRRMTDIILWAGAKPVFCDIDEKTLAITPDTINNYISDKTALILAPHPITNLANINEIESFAKNKNIPVFFDSVEGFGASYQGKRLGGFGLAETFSMEPSKVLNSGEGGYITTNNDVLAQKLRNMRTSPNCDHVTFDIQGMNLIQNEVHAALGLASFAEFAHIMSDNKTQHQAYEDIFSNINGLDLILYDKREDRNHKSCLVHINSKWILSRELTLRILNEENVWVRAYYNPPLHYATNKKGLTNAILPVTEKVTQEYMLFPLGSTVTVKDIKQIGKLLKAIEKDALALKAQEQKSM